MGENIRCGPTTSGATRTLGRGGAVGRGPFPGLVEGSLYSRGVEEWDVYVVHEVRAWIDGLDPGTHARVVQAIDLLAELGPGLGRPLVDTIKGSRVANLKELRVGTARILFVFDPWRASVLLVAGDKAGRWTQWYVEAIPLAEARYEIYLKERASGEDEHAPGRRRTGGGDQTAGPVAGEAADDPRGRRGRGRRDGQEGRR